MRAAVKKQAMGAIFGLCSLAGAASAGQPISESMATCAGIFRTMSEWVSDANAVQRLDRLSDQWLDASIEQARREGVHYPAFYAAAIQDEAIAEWQERGRLAVFSEDMEDWGDYCRALAANRGFDFYAEVSVR